MTPFLKQIAKHYIGTAEDISRLVFVFPSHRAVVFFRKYLAQVVSESAHGPVIAPQMITISDFFERLSPRRKADNLTLVLKLYDCYRALCVQRKLAYESLDEFVFWGDVILRDFEDVDKYLLDASDIFQNVSDLKDLSDDFSYLSKTQEDAIRAFLGHFRKEGEYKLRFAKLWNLLGQLYADFNAALDAGNMAYQGKIYREIARDFDYDITRAFPGAEQLVFCGLNVLCEAEKKVLGRLRDLGLAQFCWDWQSAWIRDPQNKASLFMKDNLQAFPQAFELEDTANPQLQVTAVPSAIGQTKLLSRMLQDQAVPADESTAIVLPDESLLQPLLNSIPDRVSKVNVTMGYSMASSSFFTLMGDIAQMQLRLRVKDGQSYFYHRPFWCVASNNLFDSLLSPEDRTKLQDIKKDGRYYISAEAVKGSELLELVFRPVVTDVKLASDAQIREIENYQIQILDFIGRRIAADDRLVDRFSLELDFAMEYVKSVNLMAAKHMDILPQTYFGLLDSSLKAKAIPIKGEPLSGLQIMGPLETRALDFRHVFILSCNEGVFPRGEAQTSFIPPLLRKAFGLPGYEYQDAVWAYYFYRLIQRASRVDMLLDSRSEGIRSGEESRYIKQLQYHFGADMKKASAVASPKAVPQDDVIEKTDAHIAKIRSKELSPTTLQNYLACKMKFFYSYVMELRPEEEISESMDAGIIGNVYHKVMEKLYRRADRRVTKDYLLSLKDGGERISELVDSLARYYMKRDSIEGRDIVFCTMICKYVAKTIERDLEFMEQEGVDGFDVIALEEPYHAEICGFKFKGQIDRLDSFHPGEIRLVDYKTGKVLPNDTGITDSNASAIAAKIFDPATEGKDRPKIALQFYLYDAILEQNGLTTGKVVKNSVYSTRSIMQSMPVNTYWNGTFAAAMEKELQKCLDEIVNKKVPFTKKDAEYQDITCKMCDFKNICGR